MDENFINAFDKYSICDDSLICSLLYIISEDDTFLSEEFSSM